MAQGKQIKHTMIYGGNISFKCRYHVQAVSDTAVKKDWNSY